MKTLAQQYLRRSGSLNPPVSSSSYIDDPKDAMNLTVQLSKLPNVPNHVASMVIDGVSKQLNVATQNSNYQHL
jgi:hypothetical protein